MALLIIRNIITAQIQKKNTQNVIKKTGADFLQAQTVGSCSIPEN